MTPNLRDHIEGDNKRMTDTKVTFTIGTPWQKTKDDWIVPIYAVLSPNDNKAFVIDAVVPAAEDDEGPEKALRLAAYIASALEITYRSNEWHREHFADTLAADAQSVFGNRDAEGRLIDPTQTQAYQEAEMRRRVKETLAQLDRDQQEPTDLSRWLPQPGQVLHGKQTDDFTRLQPGEDFLTLWTYRDGYAACDGTEPDANGDAGFVTMNRALTREAALAEIALWHKRGFIFDLAPGKG